MKILVTDAQVRNSVAVVRALGKKGHEVYTCDADKIATGFFSKYVKKYFVHPDNIKFQDEYIQSVKDFVTRENIEVILPIRDESTFVISKNREKLGNQIKIPIPDFSKIQKASDKAFTFKIAEEIGIPIPKTYFPEKLEDLEKVETFPVVLKPTFSSGSRGISFCQNLIELKYEFASKIDKFNKFIVQDYIPISDKENSEFDWYCIYDWNSKMKAHGCFRRIRSYPLNSGPSTLKESVENEEINKYAAKILDHLKWQGLAQLDFRVDSRDNVPKLMEINPRAWASMEHSIRIGMDVPGLWLNLALGNPIANQAPIRTGVKSRWLLPGDILWFLSAPKTWKNFKSFFTFKGADYELLQKGDLKPVLGFFLASIFYLFNKNKREQIIRKKF